MILEQINVKQKTSKDVLPSWYKSSERAKHPHPKKLKVECSLDEDVIQWLKGKTAEDEEYPIYINHYLKKLMTN
jgi:hypothetical protein